MAFFLYSSNSLTKLADSFLNDVYLKMNHSDDASCFLEPVRVSVLTAGMSAWLLSTLARHSEIAANIRTPFIRSEVESVLEAMDIPEPLSQRSFRENMEIFQPEKMSWRIFSWLSDREKMNALTRLPDHLKAYLADDPELRKRYQFSEKLAGLYDQYFIYRRDLMRVWRSDSWEKLTGDEAWESEIFRHVFAGCSPICEYLDKFLDPSTNLSSLKLRGSYSIFGAGVLPPVFLHFYQRLSELPNINVFFFYMNPCSIYWEDVSTIKEARKAHISIEEIHDFVEINNPVLAANCAQGRAFFHEMFSVECEEKLIPHNYYEDEFHADILHRIQQDIYTNRNQKLEKKTTVAASSDESLIVNSCHSRIREIEVLHDQLLKSMNNDGVTPGEILVMVPDINDYAAGIESVFSQGPLRNHYVISDRSLEEAGGLIGCFQNLLSIACGTFCYSEILSLLAYDMIRDRFGFSQDFVQRLRVWLDKSGVRWGIDRDMHFKECGVAFSEASWREGLDRLLLGYALKEDVIGADEIPELYPLDAVEGSDAEPFGNFLSFAESMFTLHSELEKQRTPAEWVAFLLDLLETFFYVSDEKRGELSSLTEYICSFGENAGTCQEKLPFSLISDFLKKPVHTKDKTRFMSGKITFCSMIPMRTIPMKIIAVLGLNERDFPRQQNEPGFNLIALSVKITDRSRRMEDRYLFLETILSAEKKLILSYIGFNLKDNSQEPPSAVVSELLDYLESAYGFDPVIKHKLQAYDPVYFSGVNPKYYSYSAQNAYAAACLVKRLTDSRMEEQTVYQQILQRGPLPEEFALPSMITLEELENFFLNPAEAYLGNVFASKMNTFLKREVPDTEPFEVDVLNRSSLCMQIFDMTKAGMTEPVQLSRLQNSGKLPIGKNGKQIFEDYRLLSDEMIRKTQAFEKDEKPLCLNVNIGGRTVLGRVQTFNGCTKVLNVKFSNLNVRNLIQTLFSHLLLCSAGYEVTSSLFSRQKTKDDEHCSETLLPPFSPAEASAYLEKLVGYMEYGMRLPLPFFPSLAFVIFKDKNEEKKTVKLYTNLKKTFYPTNDIMITPPFSSLFSNKDFDDMEFRNFFYRITDDVFQPYLSYCVKEKKK